MRRQPGLHLHYNADTAGSEKAREKERERERERVKESRS